MARVWPNTHVDEGNLKFQISALRRTLGGGNRYLVNVPGRGYSFVAPVARAEEARTAAPEPPQTENAHNLPALLTRLIGRDDTITRLARSTSATAPSDHRRRGRDRQDLGRPRGGRAIDPRLRAWRLADRSGAARGSPAGTKRASGRARARNSRRKSTTRLGRQSCGIRRCCWCLTIASMSSTRRLPWQSGS